MEFDNQSARLKQRQKRAFFLNECVGQEVGVPWKRVSLSVVPDDQGKVGEVRDLGRIIRALVQIEVQPFRNEGKAVLSSKEFNSFKKFKSFKPPPYILPRVRGGEGKRWG